MSEHPEDAKDWTWTIERACPDCGFAAPTVVDDDIPGLLAAFARPWPDRLAGADARARPAPGTWSPLEYAAHVRDICRLFAARTDLMLTEDEPGFADWDQESAALESEYAAQDPGVVAGELGAAAGAWASRFTGLSAEQWDRGGVRGDGVRLTVRTLARYGLHEMAHHLWDVGVPAGSARDLDSPP